MFSRLTREKNDAVRIANEHQKEREQERRERERERERAEWSSEQALLLEMLQRQRSQP